MNLIEEFNMTDSLGLSGFVIITDNKTGKVLLKKHNMILAGAKRVLLSKLLCDCSTGISEDATSKHFGLELENLNLLYKNKENVTDVYNYKDYYIRYCKFYNDDNDVVYNEEINYSKDEEKFILSFNLDATTATSDYITSNDNNSTYGMLITSIEEVDNHYRLKFSVNLTTEQEEPIKFTSLSLVMDHPNNLTGKNHKNNLEIPFSRIKFDPIILTQESSLNLTYYVYF